MVICFVNFGASEISANVHARLSLLLKLKINKRMQISRRELIHYDDSDDTN